MAGSPAAGQCPGRLGQGYVWLGPQQRQVNPLLASLPAEGWTRLRAGDGATGPRWYDWRWLPLATPLLPGGRRWLLVRRRLSAPADRTASVVFAPPAPPLEEVVRVAGRRWTIARGVEEAQGEVGLDHDAVQELDGWYRPITLALGALALLTSLRAGTIALEAFKKSLPPRRQPSGGVQGQARPPLPLSVPAWRRWRWR